MDGREGSQLRVTTSVGTVGVPDHIMVHMHTAEYVSFRVQEVHESWLSACLHLHLGQVARASGVGNRVVRGCLFGEQFYSILF